MLSLETLHRLNDQIAVEAAEEGLVPYVPYDADEVDYWPPFPLPDLGYLQPDGWERTEQTWLVDDTGHGYESEPALTGKQFKQELRDYIAANPGHGFAITERGEFQVVVSAFRPDTLVPRKAR